ncbi:hypothetical protein GALMADRAFT_1228359 [Galerina marginata CBS 339.88]|uniref:RING-type domain-containing protein n=1 Tax=Galerina marginata (strain CBS 339.88) TaxID=685588 RepID=A0A067TJQ6_GALM3|nr:hypothetical protein GALMADRAFT_1228359 [Galerina marginata CBS 339.88]
MLTLAPGCACDVCAEEYGSQRLPHSIPCGKENPGHVLCASCISTIVEKTSPRLAPVCPFCREQFTHDSARLIRMDFATSGWSTPRRFPAMETLTDFNSEVLQRKTAHLLSTAGGGGDKTRIEVRRLEDKVAKVAAKKCSVEEVSSLYKELEEWLLSEKDDQTSSILLSAALLRAILMNHLAHSEASKTAKTTEANLKNKIEDIDLANSKMEAEIRRQRSQYNQKSQECQQLRAEVGQLRMLATTLGITPPEMPSLPSAPTSPTPSPTPYSSSQSPYSPSSSTTSTGRDSQTTSPTSPLSRFNAMHSRSASMSSRPTTPASAPLSPTRSHTPAPPRSHTPAPPRSHTPGPGHSSASAAAAAMTPPRSHTPGPNPSLRSQTPSIRSHTPAPSSSHYHSSHSHSSHAVPPMPSLPVRYATPAPSLSAHHTHRTQTPAPLVPPKPRRLSTPSPPKMMVRSTSEEKAEAHERWIPPGTVVNHDDDYVVRPSDRERERERERDREGGKERFGLGLGLGRSGSVRPASRAGFASRFGF